MTPIRLSADFSTESLQARREWLVIFKVMKGKKLQPRTLSSARLSDWWRNQKLYRQAKVKRIQHHQTSFTTNARGTSLGRKHKTRERPTEINPKLYILIITLNVNGLNVPTKRPRLPGCMKTCACKHFHLSHHSAWPPQTVCNDSILFRLIMFPLWLAAVTIFYFLPGYWLWKPINIFYYCDYITVTHLIP